MKTKKKSIVSKGKTVKHALTVALDLLNESMDDVDIEVLENESKGILGFGAKEAVVRVTVKEKTERSFDDVEEMSPPAIDLETEVRSLEFQKETVLPTPTGAQKKPKSSEFDLAGKAWVTDGQIFCKDAPDKYPVVSPAKGMKLYKDSQLVEDTIIISENDILSVELEDETKDSHWELSVNHNKTEAVMKVIPGEQIFRKLKDKEPQYHLELEVEEKKILFFINSEAVMEKLREMGITHGVNYSEIALACTTEEAGSFVIAKGSEPTRGNNGIFLPLQEMEVKKGLKEHLDGRVDYREIQQFPSIEPGQVVGLVQPPIPGVPGKTVTNEPVFPPEVYPLVLQAGKGVVLVEDDTKVVATESGQPDIKIKGLLAQISVIPKLTIASDVDLQVGNVRYSGEVEIAGAVQDGMLVEAQGNVTVHQNVNMAKIYAGRSVLIHKNIIGSEVTAGSNSMLLSEMNELLGDLMLQMRNMMTAIQQLTTVSAFKAASFGKTGMGPLIKILCDGKFKGFPHLLNNILEKIKTGEGRLDPEWGAFGESLRKGFTLVHASDLRSLEDLAKVLKKTEELFAETQDAGDEAGSFIKAGFAQNCRLYASGDISLVGQGAYHSKLRSGGFVEIDGYVRGGEIYAKLGAKIKEVGTKGGIATKIIVPKGSAIRIQTVMEDTLIQVGSRTHKFTAQTSNVYARLGEDGELLI